MSEYRIWLPFPPSTNNLYAHGLVAGKIRRFPTSRYKAWTAEAIVRIRAAHVPLYTVPVVVHLTLVPPDNRERDMDNPIKPILDALVKGGVMTDDSNRYGKGLTVYWENAAATHGVIVDIRPALDVRKPQLDAGERAYLSKLNERGLVLVGPEHKQGKALKSLINKGYVEELPGVLEGTPQGFKPI